MSYRAIHFLSRVRPSDIFYSYKINVLAHVMCQSKRIPTFTYFIRTCSISESIGFITNACTNEARPQKWDIMDAVCLKWLLLFIHVDKS